MNMLEDDAKHTREIRGTVLQTDLSTNGDSSLVIDIRIQSPSTVFKCARSGGI